MKKLKLFKALCALGLLMPLASCGDKSTETNTSNLNDEVYKIYQLAQNSGYEGTYEEWLDSIKGEKGDNIELRVSNGYIQWKPTGETTWKNLISIEDLKGKDGSSGKDGLTPTITIDEEGYWVINGEVSNVKALVETPTIEISADGYWVLNSEKTETKAFGEDGKTPEITIGDNGNWFINGVDTNKSSLGKDGTKVTIGNDGYWYISGVKTNTKAIGKDGNSYYVWIKYSDGFPLFSSDCYDRPTSKTQYMGIYSGTLDSAPVSHTYYNWIKIHGEDGKNGTNGTNGKDATIPDVTITLESIIPSALKEYGVTGETFLSGWKTSDQEVYSYSKKIERSSWLGDDYIGFENLPSTWFDGWYIKGTNKLIDAYTCIGGDVIIEARWNEDAIREYIKESLDFEIIGGKITSYKGTKEDVVIPEVYIPSGYIKPVTEINKDVFKDKDMIKSIRISKNIKTISNLGLATCPNLESLTVDPKNPFYDSRENCNAIIETGSNMMIEMCKNTKIPNSILSIYSKDSNASITIPNEIEEISVFGSAKNVYLSSSIKALGSCSGVENLYYDGSLLDWFNLSTPEVSNPSHMFVKENDLWIEIGGEFEIPSGITTIKTKYFKGLPITKIIIPEGVTLIEENAFYKCLDLKEVVLPSSIKTFEKDCFSDCINLTDVYYNGTVLDWCNIDFENYEANPIWYASGSSTELGNFQKLTDFHIKTDDGYELLKDVVIPDTITVIKQYAFTHMDIETLTMGNSVTKIEDQAFDFCGYLKTIKLSDNLTYIHPNAFYGAGVFGLAYTTYKGGNYIGSENNPYMFFIKPVEDVTTITLHKDCKFIVQYAFSNSPSLECFNLEKDSLLTEIPWIFSNCTSLKSIMVSKETTILREYYKDFSNFDTVYYQGTEEEWNKIEIVKKYTLVYRLLNATKYFYSETAPLAAGNYWHYDTDGLTPVIWE